jgi:hypothetical protein
VSATAAFARVRAPQSLSGALSELAARNRLPDRIQEISHVKRFSEELETVFRGKLHRPHVPGDHYDRQPHALGVKGKLRAWLAGYPAIENRSITSGCCHLARHEMTLEPKVMMMLIDFHTCVVRDGIDLFAAHAEFLKIDEYRQRTRAHRRITVRRIHHHDASNAVVELAVETRRPLQPII